MSEHVEHVIADGPAPAMPDPDAEIAIIEAQADATADVIEAQADAEVKIIEARAENPEWQAELRDAIRLQGEFSLAAVEALRTDMTLALASLSERMDRLTQQQQQQPEPDPPNPDPEQSENPPDRSGETSEKPEATEPAPEPEKPERKRAHRWI